MPEQPGHRGQSTESGEVRRETEEETGPTELDSILRAHVHVGKPLEDLPFCLRQFSV